MAKPIMIQGTASNVGKSMLVAGLCRLFAEDGYKVAPFKAQNMALNSFITFDGLELGRAQAAQAYASMKEPDVRMNPVLLKPTSHTGSQVIVNGEVIGNMTASEYFTYRKELIPIISSAYDSLATENDIVVIEGAGSPAEINLRQNDIANMGVAELLKAPVILAGDIDKGGVFASLYGTVMLLSEKERNYIKGVIINKFRGDIEILKPGLKMLEDLIHIPVTGVVPYVDIEFDAEDSLSGGLLSDKAGSPDIAVIKLPHISNFTDFAPLGLINGVSVRYITSAEKFGHPDFLIIPGTKNTMADLEWLRSKGFEEHIRAHMTSGKPLMGICGGFQMLTERITDTYFVEHGGQIHGLGIFDFPTVFQKNKTRSRVSGEIQGVTGVFNNLNGKPFEGYEIHMGTTECGGAFPIVSNGNIYGTYVHGIFDNFEVLDAVASALGVTSWRKPTAKGIFNMADYQSKQYSIISDVLRENLSINNIYRIINKGI